MQRRSFVQASVLGATTSGLTSACSRTPEGTNVPGGPDDELHARLAHLDREMEDLRCRPVDLGRVARAAANDVGVCREDPLDAQLYRSSLRALLLTAHIKDIPAADRQRPEVQARLDAHAAEVDFAVLGMSHRLASMTPAEIGRVQDRLRDDPEMARRIVEYIDEEARKSDYPLGRRLRLRRLAKTALWRLRRQPAELVIRECTDKVERLAERAGPIARKQPFAHPRTEEVAYWQAQTLLVMDRYQDPATAAPVMTAPPPTSEPAVAADPGAELAAVAELRKTADAVRARAEMAEATSPASAAADFDSAGSLYEKAANQLPETDQYRSGRAVLLDQAIDAHLRAHALTGSATPLRLALNILHTHDAAYRAAYGERRATMPEYVKLQAHRIHVQELLLRVPPPSAGGESPGERRRRLLQAGGITAGVGLGLLLLGLGLLFGAELIITGAILATFAGIALLVGIIILIVGAALRAT